MELFRIMCVEFLQQLVSSFLDRNVFLRGFKHRFAVQDKVNVLNMDRQILHKPTTISWFLVQKHLLNFERSLLRCNFFQ